MSEAPAAAPPFRVQAVEYPRAMAELHGIREAVFVREQQVPAELERDALDPACLHVVARALDGEAIGTGRLVPPSLDQPAKIGRMAVSQAMRGSRIGRHVLDALMKAARERGDQEAVLHAQVSASAFYARAGFSERGSVFDEAGIPHVEMVRTL